MTPTARYERLRDRIVRQAKSLLYKHKHWIGGTKNYHWVLDDLLGVAEVAFCQALSQSHRCTIAFDDWVLLNTNNAMQNYVRSEKRFRARNRMMDSGEVAYFCDKREAGSNEVHERLRGVSEDARTAAECLSSLDVEKAKEVLYIVLGWRRCWSAIDELRVALGG